MRKLVIVLGLMVSLARYVRHELAVEASKDLLHRLDAMLQQYMTQHDGTLPVIAPFVPPGLSSRQMPDEPALQHNRRCLPRNLPRVSRHIGLPDASQSASWTSRSSR